jgi:peptidyl-prolyl cis-trans isomerase A (cyclophilin A)
MRILPFAIAALFLGLAGCGDTGSDGAGAEAGRDSCANVKRADLDLDNATAPVVALATSKGCIVAELHQDKAPITVANFLTYTDEGFYGDLLFHRIIKDFMVQTGGMTKEGDFKTATHPAIKNEARTSGLKNEAYTLSMARGQGADSATNQFFINHKANTFLDASASSAGYAVFGKVVQGKDVVDAIAGVPVEAYQAGLKCQQDSQPSCPVEDVDLFSITRVA